jgi:hypothetical protein
VRVMSWEHFVLGSLDPEAIRAAAVDPRGGQLEQCCALLEELGRDPLHVDAARLQARFPGAQPLRLPGSGLVVALGELNTLPDYFSRPAELERAPARYLLPILQSVRTWNISQLRRTIGLAADRPRLADAMSYPRLGGLAEIAEGFALARHGRQCGIEPQERYPAVLSRNAGHFAPFSWYRWQRFHLEARDLLARAAACADPAEAGSLRLRARISAAFGDHFLQDSFAAGHLINKTLVMQWYVEWLAASPFPLPERDQLAAMTVAAQPYLHGPGHYEPVPAPDGSRVRPSRPPGTPPVTDPQAAAEAATLEERIAASGVIAADPSQRSAAYAAYLAFLSSSVASLAPGVIHGYFNRTSLVTASGPAAEAGRYRIWGDWTMLASQEGAGRAADAAAASRRAIAELLRDGSTDVTSEQVFRQFPDRVEQDGVLLSLPDWHREHLHGQCVRELFRLPSAQFLRVITPLTLPRFTSSPR